MSRSFAHTVAVALVAVAVPSSAAAELRVVTTVPDLAAIAAEVGGSHVTVRSLSLSTQDPHFVDAKPSLALALNKADVLIAVGLDLEVGWLSTLQTGARNRDIVAGGRGFLDCSVLITPLDVPTGTIDRAKGDIHPSGNPHYLTDPRNAVAVARGIAEHFATVDPNRATAYRDNAASFARRVDDARAGWEQRLEFARGAPVVPYHKSFVYLARWVGFDQIGYVEPKAGVSPSPRHVARIIAAGRTRKARAVLVEAYYPTRTAKLVASKMGARLVKIPGGTAFRQGETYIDRMNKLVTLLEGALR